MKLTKIAIALVVVLAMSAVVASGASAKKLISNAATNVSLSGEDTGKTHKFTVDGQNVTCEKAVFNTGTIALPASTVTANAVYTNCTAFGFAATVNMGNCHYRINTPTKLAEDNYTASVDVICNATANSANNVINVNTNVFGSECSVSIGAQANKNHILIKNETANVPKDLSLNITVAETITATKNKDNGLCPLSGTGTVNNASYNGVLTIKDTGGKDIFLEN